MRKLIAAVAAVCALTAPAALAQSALPDKIALPDGFAPEGIEIAGGKTFYVGSTQTGAIYSGSLRTGAGRILIPGAAAGTRAATGIEYEHGRLWVAGAAGGTARVYDVKTRALVREYHLAPAASTFINDVVVTKAAAYFTDSQRPVISRIAIGHDGAPGALTHIPLSGDYHHIAGQFNLNGIVASADGKQLIAVSTAGRKLYLIDATTGVAHVVEALPHRRDDRRRPRDRDRVVHGRQRRRPDARREAAVRRAEPVEPDRDLPPLQRPPEGGRHHGHQRPGPRRADDDRPGRQPRLRGERALRHGDALRSALRHRQGRRWLKTTESPLRGSRADCLEWRRRESNPRPRTRQGGLLQAQPAFISRRRAPRRPVPHWPVR